MDKDLEKRVTMIAEAVSGLKYYEWSRIKMAIFLGVFQGQVGKSRGTETRYPG